MVAISNRVPVILASWYSCLYVVPTPSQWIGLACGANRTLKWGLRSYVIEDVAVSTLLSLGSLVLGKLEACCEDIQAALGQQLSTSWPRELDTWEADPPAPAELSEDGGGRGLTSWLQPHERPSARTTQLNCS